MRHKDEGKRQAIYDSAIILITQQGLAGTSMAKIAKEAEVSPATIYTYFDNKDDMLNKLYLKIKEDSASFLFRNFDTAMDVKEGVALFFKRMFQYFTENPLRLSIHEQMVNSPHVSKEAQEEGAALYAPLVELYMRGMEEGSLRAYPVALSGSMILGTVFQLAKMHLNGDHKVSEEDLDAAVEMLWRAVGR